MIKVKEKTWDDITINLYRQIGEICTDNETDDVTKDVELIGLLFGIDEKEIWDMAVEEVAQYKGAMNFLTTPVGKTPRKIDKVNIRDTVYEVCTDLQKFTYSQFVDFQSYWAKGDDNITDVMSVLLVPEGHKYGSGYDIKQLKKDIDENMSIATATSVAAFFLTSLVKSLEHSLRYLEKKTKIAKSLPIKKSQKEKEAIAEAMNRIREIKSILGSAS